MKIEISIIDNNDIKYYGEFVLSKVKPSKIKSLKINPTKKSKRKSLAGAISELINENFFDSPKSLNEIIEKLKSNAVFYPKTSFPESLLRLIKNKDLRRLKDGTKWVYVKYG